MKHLSEKMLSALFGHLYMEADLAEWYLECAPDHEFTRTEAWLMENIGFGYARVLDEFRALGVFCDCDALLELPTPRDWKGTQDEWEEHLRAKYKEEWERAKEELSYYPNEKAHRILRAYLYEEESA